MADTNNDIKLNPLDWVDVYTLSGIAAGGEVTLENHSSAPIYLFISADKPDTPPVHGTSVGRVVPEGYLRLEPHPHANSIRTVSGGQSGLWALGSGPLNVQEGAPLSGGGGGGGAGGSTGIPIFSEVTAISETAEVTVPDTLINKTQNYFILHFFNNGTEVAAAGINATATITVSDNGVAFATTSANTSTGVVESLNFDVSTGTYPRFNALSPTRSARLSVANTSGITHIQLELVKL